MGTMTSEIGQQAFEKEDEYAQFLGVDRNTIVSLEPEKRKKLDLPADGLITIDEL